MVKAETKGPQALCQARSQAHALTWACGQSSTKGPVGPNINVNVNVNVNVNNGVMTMQHNNDDLIAISYVASVAADAAMKASAQTGNAAAIAYAEELQAQAKVKFDQQFNK